MARRLDRLTHQLDCRIQEGAEQHSGRITDLSSDGLFVETDGALRPGTQVVIQIEETGDVPQLVARAIVVRIRLVRGEKHQLTSHGVGLRILQAPDSYYALAEAKGRPEIPSDEESSFRVTVREKAGSSYRSLRLTCASQEQARQEIAEELGPDWEVTEVEEVRD